VLGTPVTPAQSGTLCDPIGPNGGLVIDIKPIDAPGWSVLLVENPGNQPIAGMGDQAFSVKGVDTATIWAMKGNTAIEVAVQLTGKTLDEMLATATQLATEIIGKV